MKGLMTIIYPNRRISLVRLTRAPHLEELQMGVGGGPIEVVPGFDSLLGLGKCVAFCHEEGKLEGMELNDMATALWHIALQLQGIAPCDVLVGPVAIITGDDSLLKSL